MSGTKIIILLSIAAVLITLGYFATTKWIPNLKRTKLSEGISTYAKKLGKNVTPDQIKTALVPATNQEIDKLIDFAKLLQANDLVGAAGMTLSVLPILKKTDLQDILF